MKKAHLISLAAILAMGVASPALADWDRIGSIDVSYQKDKDSTSPSFGGPVERLQFTARGSDIVCRNIRVTFDDGTGVKLFQGTLRQGAGKSVDLPGRSQRIKRIYTACHTDRRSGATIDISADIGRYRDTWRRSPDWDRTWSRMFSWGNSASNSVGQAIDKAVNYWVTVGSTRFTRGDNRDGFVPSGAGNSLNAVGLQADDDADCSMMRTTFRSGATQDFRPGVLHRGQRKSFDLTGQHDKNLTRVQLRCQPVHGRDVTVTVLGNK